MKIIQLRRNPRVYTCYAYLVLGDWNRLEDVNTLVDVGVDGFVLDEIERTSTGCGKKGVDQVILTHSHFDHAGGLAGIIDRYHPKVYAYANLEGVDEVLQDGQTIRMGDENFEVIHTPGHSNDSICLYCARERVLFSGDTTLRVMTPQGSYEPEFLRVIERIERLNIEKLFSGHDHPMTERVKEMIRCTLGNIRRS